MRPTDPARLDHILNTVAEHTGVSVADMMSRGPSGDRLRPQIRTARNIAYWTAYRSGHGKISMEAIGKRFGRTHGTVSSAVSIVDRRREVDADFKRMTDDIRFRLAARVDVEDIRRGSACAGPDGKRWIVVRVDQKPDELQWVVAKNEQGGSVQFARRDATKWLKLI